MVVVVVMAGEKIRWRMEREVDGEGERRGMTLYLMFQYFFI
jgi:hypothetical protein